MNHISSNKRSTSTFELSQKVLVLVQLYSLKLFITYNLFVGGDESEDNLQESSLSFRPMGPRDET